MVSRFFVAITIRGNRLTHQRSKVNEGEYGGGGGDDGKIRLCACRGKEGIGALETPLIQSNEVRHEGLVVQQIARHLLRNHRHY